MRGAPPPHLSGRRSAQRFDFIGSALSSFGLHRFARIAANPPGREILAAANRLESRFEARTVRFELLPDLEVSSVALDGESTPLIQEARHHDESFYPEFPEASRRTLNVFKSGASLSMC